MIESQEDIANRALRKLGSQPLVGAITATNDKNAIVMNSIYEDTLEAVLGESFWSFAMKRILLDTALSDYDPAWTKHGLEYTYVVPSDFVRLKGWNTESARVIREGNVFRSDTPDLGILYVYFNTTISQYPIYFIEAFVDKLALDASYTILQGPPETKYLEERYAVSLAGAVAKDYQDGSQLAVKCDTWVNGRFSGHLDNGDGGLYYR